VRAAVRTLGAVKVVILLGSGASVYAGMPTVGAITQRVLTGSNVMWTGSGWRAVDRLPQNHDVFLQELRAIVASVGELKTLCDTYFRSQDKARESNYEDIAYVARQIEDGLSAEYENPALLPLIERLETTHGNELERLAGATADYIEDIVRSLLGNPAGPFDHLTAIVDAVLDAEVDELTIATLNHDTVLERAFDLFGVQIVDGFDDEFGTLRIWNDRFPISRRLLKLHGSINWWRYTLTRDDWTGQFTARAIDGDAEHARGPNDERLDYPALGRPLILTGTFNKILAYPTGIYADQHFRFHEALRDADAMMVIGYGFRDKAINARIVAWAERSGDRRMVVVHPDPDRLGRSARGAIRNKWLRWQNTGLLRFVPEYLTPATTWAAIRGQLLG
jgi:hypothetical protein